MQDQNQIPEKDGLKTALSHGTKKKKFIYIYTYIYMDIYGYIYKI